MNHRFIKFRRCFENENTPPGGTTPAPAPSGDDGKKLSVAEVNAIVEKRIAEERKKFEKREQMLTAKLNELDLTAKQKAELEAQLEELRIQSLSKEEQIKAKAEKERKELEMKAKTYEAEAKSWQKRYSEEKVQTELFAAAEAGEAFRAQQIVDLLKGRARLADVLDPQTNKPTGKFQTLVSIETVQDGQVKVIDVSPADAVKAMRETDPNLFKSNLQGGLGRGQSPSSGGSQSLTKMPLNDFVKSFQAGTLPRA